MKTDKLHPLTRTGIDILAIASSLGLCLILLPTRLPGMEIMDVGPSWLVMWTIAWSIHRSLWNAVAAGVALGLIQDAMTLPASTAIGTIPTHVLSLTTVAVLAAWLYKHRYLNDSVLSVAIGTGLLTLIAELILGVQELFQTVMGRLLPMDTGSLVDLWQHQVTTIAISAILSGLWMPILYYPLHLWWQKLFAKVNLD